MDTHNHDALLHSLFAEVLFALASTSDDEEQAWSAIERLRSINTEQIFTEAVRFCHSPEARERRVGVDVIAQFGLPEQTYHEPVVLLLINMLETEHTPMVIESIAIALRHRSDERAVGPLLGFEQHPDAAVRYGVVFGLLGHTDPRAVACLIRLSADPDAQVRDWATFGLAQQIDTDTPALREALIARLQNEDEDAAGEAMVGLALRKDGRVVAPLLKLLHTGEIGRLPLEAAAILADPVLLPELEQLRTQWKGDQDWYYELLLEAIEACTPPL